MLAPTQQDFTAFDNDVLAAECARLSYELARLRELYHAVPVAMADRYASYPGEFVVAMTEAAQRFESEARLSLEDAA